MSPILTGVIASGITGQLNTWSPEGAYDALASATVGAGGVASITFSGIPSGYKHLQIRALNKVNAGTPDMFMYVNGDSGSSYKFKIFRTGTSGSNATSENYTAASVYNPVSSNFQTSIIDILDYSSSVKNKTTKVIVGRDENSTSAGEVGMWTSVWLNNSPITSLTFTPNASTNISQYSHIALYGVK